MKYERNKRCLICFDNCNKILFQSSRIDVRCWIYQMSGGYGCPRLLVALCPLPARQAFSKFHTCCSKPPHTGLPSNRSILQTPLTHVNLSKIPSCRQRQDFVLKVIKTILKSVLKQPFTITPRHYSLGFTHTEPSGVHTQTWKQLFKVTSMEMEALRLPHSCSSPQAFIMRDDVQPPPLFSCGTGREVSRQIPSQRGFLPCLRFQFPNQA